GWGRPRCAPGPCCGVGEEGGVRGVSAQFEDGQFLPRGPLFIFDAFFSEAAGLPEAGGDEQRDERQGQQVPENPAGGEQHPPGGAFGWWVPVHAGQRKIMRSTAMITKMSAR